jgi:hypothetical protein
MRVSLIWTGRVEERKIDGIEDRTPQQDESDIGLPLANAMTRMSLTGDPLARRLASIDRLWSDGDGKLTISTRRRVPMPMSYLKSESDRRGRTPRRLRVHILGA